MNLKILKLLVLLVLISITISCAENNNPEDSVVMPEDTTVVQIHGLLQVNGNRILNQHSAPVCFAGNSFFWSNDNWGGERYYKFEVVSWLKLDWKTTIVRAAMGVEDPGGYLDNKTANKNRVKTVVDAAIDEGLYVIIDWHSHHAEDNTNEAALFFQEMANLYGEYDNVIYELYNEPLDISWSNIIKPYAISIIATIRSIDPDNLIVVGTPEWSQRVVLLQLTLSPAIQILLTLCIFTLFTTNNGYATGPVQRWKAASPFLSLNGGQSGTV